MELMINKHEEKHLHSMESVHALMRLQMILRSHRQGKKQTSEMMISKIPLKLKAKRKKMKKEESGLRRSSWMHWREVQESRFKLSTARTSFCYGTSKKSRPSTPSAHISVSLFWTETLEMRVPMVAQSLASNTTPRFP